MAVKIVFLDCDGTLTKVRSSWEYLHRELNLWDANADEYQELFRAGEIDYYEFCRRDALLWEGLWVSRVDEIVRRIPYQEDAAVTVARLRELGIITVIVSSGLSLLVNRVQADLSVDLAVSNELVAQAGYLTGVVRINVGYNRKDQIVRHVLLDLGLTREESAAVGDGDGDKGMFESVGLPISFGEDGACAAGLPGACNVKRLSEAVEIIAGRA